MNPLALLALVGVPVGGWALIEHNKATAAAAAQQTTPPVLTTSGSLNVPKPAVQITPSSPATPSSAPAVPSSTGNPIADVANFLSTVDDVLTGATATGDFPVSAVVATTDTGSAGALNIRATPATSGSVVTTAAHGSLIGITGPAVPGDGSQPGGWAPVTTGTDVGYASMAFLNTDPAAVAAAGST